MSAWLWFTVLFANFAEAIAEGRGKAQAAALRGSRQDISAKKLVEPRHGASRVLVKATQLEKGDVVLVEAGDTIPLDGEVIEGVASVNESAITGRIRAGDPRIGRRFLLGHGRHARAVGLAGGAHHRAARASRSSTA